VSELFDTILTALWRDGFFHGDAARLERLVAAHPGERVPTELVAFTTLALAFEDRVDDELPALPDEPRGDGPATVLIHAALAARALQLAPASAGRALQRLGAAIDTITTTAADPARLAAAVGLADLCIARAALAAGDRATARRRLDEVIAGRLPAGTAIAARHLLATAVLHGPGSARRARRLLDDATALALGAARPLDAAILATAAATACLSDGERATAIARLERALELAPPFAGPELVATRVLLAELLPGRAGDAVLAAGLRAAAAAGDYVSCTTLLGAAAHRVESDGSPAAALALLEQGSAELVARLGPDGDLPLRAQRAALRAALTS